MNRRFFVCLSIVVLGIAAYANSLEGPFLYDDDDSIVRNRSIRQLWPPWKAAWGRRTSPTAGRPIVNLSLAINYAMGGLDHRWGYRAFNLAVHLSCALVLFGIVDRTLRNLTSTGQSARRGVGPAFACAALWLLHPMHTECVNYITQRTESMMALCYLLTLYCAIRAHGTDARTTWAVAAVVACAAGMATKETMVTAPAVVLLYDWAYRSETIRKTLRQRWPLHASLAATWGILAALMLAGPRSNTVGFDLGVSAGQYSLNQCMIVIDYLRLLVWPFPVILDYGVPRELSWAEAAPFAVALAVLVVAALVTLAWRPAVGFAAVSFFIVLAPTSTCVPIASEVGAERRAYLPSAALIVLGAACVFWLFKRVERTAADRNPDPGGEAGRKHRYIAAAVVIALAAILLFATRGRNTVYADPIVLWRACVKAVPHNARAHVNLGIALAEAGEQSAAIEKYRDALKIEPWSPEANYNLGNALSLAGQIDEAIEHFQIAVDASRKLGDRWPVEPMRRWLDRLRNAADDAERHMMFTKILGEQNRMDEVIIHYGHALRLRPGWAEPHARLAWILATSEDDAQRDVTRAVDLAERAQKLVGRSDPLILDILAAAYAAAGQFEDAVAAAQHAIELAKAAGHDQWAPAMQRHLEQYRLNKPWRE